MDRKDDRDILRRGGFDELEMHRLARLRKERDEEERQQALAEHRRLEFARWLFTTGKISEQIA